MATVDQTRRAGRPKSPGAVSKATTTACATCNEIHSGCTGHTKNGKNAGKPCGGRCVNGADCCAQHLKGGKRVTMAMERFQFAQQEGAIAELMREADIPAQHPLDGLLEVVRHTGGMMRMLHAMVMELDDAPTLEWYEDEIGVRHCVNKGQSFHGVDHDGDQAAHILVTLYEKWATMYGRACKMALDANIDERMMRNQEATSSVLFGAVGKALLRAGMTETQQKVFRLALAEELRDAAEQPALPTTPQLSGSKR